MICSRRVRAAAKRVSEETDVNFASFLRFRILPPARPFVTLEVMTLLKTAADGQHGHIVHTAAPTTDWSDGDLPTLNDIRTRDGLT